MINKKFKILVGFLTGIMIFSFSTAVLAGPAPTTTTKTTTTSSSFKDLPGGTGKINTKTGEIQNYTCTRGSQTVVIPQCFIGGIFGDPSKATKEDIDCACCGDCKVSAFLGVAIQVSKWILGLTGSLALAIFIYGGFLWLTSGGTPDRIQKGKQALTGAVIGVIIVLGAWLIINTTLVALTGKGIDDIQKEYNAKKP